MFKKSKKKLSILLVLAMVMTMLAGLAAPAGATTPVTGVVIGHVPTVVSIGNYDLANIRFAEAGAAIGNVRDGDQLTITLPSGVVFQASPAVISAVYSTPLFESPANNVRVTYPAVGAGDTTVTLTLDRGVDIFTAAQFALRLPVTVETVGSGAINVTLTTTTAGISGGTFAVGTFGTGAVTVDGTFVTGTTPATLSRFAIGAQTSNVNIRLRENAPGAFDPGILSPIADPVLLTLPEGATWATATVPAGFTTVISGRELRIVRTATIGAVPLTVNVTGITLNVNRLAALGDLTVTVTGEGANSGRVTGSVVLARVADFGIDVRRPTTGATAVPTINAGRSNADVLNNMIEVKEATAGSLIAGGTITLTLPAGVRFSAVPTVTGAGIAVAATPFSNSNRTVTFDVANAAARTVLFTFPAGSLYFSPTVVAGDVAVTVAGNAGASGTVNIATARSTFTVAAATTPTVALGSAAQVAADVVITEAAFGRIRLGNLELRLPTGFVFNGTPTVTRTSGNITLGAATLSANNVLRIPVDAVSTVTSVITVSGIRYDVSRTAMDGPVSVTVDGSSLGETGVLGAFVDTVVGNRPSVFNARVGLPVVPRLSSVFTIGALSFVRDGVTTAIDAAPSIVAGRTLLPLRFAALAVGVSGDNLLWDPVRRTVTLIGDRVVQFQIGSSSMLINGVAVPIDVAPSIVNGRTMLPIRALAQALRADIVWDGTARTVTVTPR